MIRSLRHALLAAAVAATLAGCTSVKHYVHDRAHDLADIPIVGGGLGGLVVFGPGGGLEAEVKITDLFIPAIGASEMQKFEFIHGDCIRFLERRLSFPFAPIYSLVTGGLPWPAVALRSDPYAGYFGMILRQYWSDFHLRYRQAMAMPVPASMRDEVSQVRLGSENLEGINHWWLITPFLDSNEPLINRFDVHGEATFLVVSAKLGISLGQVLDFFTGLFGLDPARDDDYPFGWGQRRGAPQAAAPAPAGEALGRPRSGDTYLIQELGIVYFDYDSSELDATDQAILRRNAEWMRQRPDMPILIEGHCDERGTDEYNYSLGERRAVATLNYLRSLGVTNELAVRSYGESRPVCTEHNEDCWQLNRRAQFMGYLE